MAAGPVPEDFAETGLKLNKPLWALLAGVILTHYGWLLFHKSRDLSLYHENRRLRHEVLRIEGLSRDIDALRDLNSDLRKHLGLSLAEARAIGRHVPADSLINRIKAMAGGTPPLQGGVPRGSPVTGVASRGFQLRSHPGDLEHPGYDLAARAGEPVYATSSGRVLFMGHTQNWGWLVILQHGEDWSTWYGHLQPPLVRLGESVRRGELLGIVAAATRKSGAHLHYAIQRQARFVDPAPFLATAPLEPVN